MVVEDSGSSSSSSWSWEQEKAFENALAIIHSEEDLDLSNRWEKIAQAVPGKTTVEIKHHYQLLLEDLNDIESGQVPLPTYGYGYGYAYAYASSSEGFPEDGGGSSQRGCTSTHSHADSAGNGGKGSRSDQERRKGIAWTEDEHRLFLLGLDKYGKGDWRSISRNFVISRTPTQVASHAQKYFIRLNSMNKDRRRASIHDITSVGNNGDISAPQGSITGQANGPVTMAGGKPAKPSPQSLPGPPVVSAFVTTIGQPVGGSLVSAVGTPVSLPVPPGPHMAYGVRVPVAGTIVPGAPMSPPPMTYPMPRISAHR